MQKIAITGNIASGKSEVEKILKEKSFKVLDTDDVAHNLLNDKSVKKQLISIFERFDIIENCSISRQKLGKVVFKYANLRKKLENVLHPLIKDEIEKFFRSLEKNEKLAFVSIPLLFEANFEYMFDKIILVYADDKIRQERLIKRNNLPESYAKNRLKIQLSQDEKINLSDFVIYNNGTIEFLRKNTEEILQIL